MAGRPPRLGPIDAGMFDSILGAVMAVAPRDPAAVRIRIPRDHPQAEALVRLARRLATEQQLASGVRVKCFERPHAVEDFLDELRQIVDVDDLLGRLAERDPTLAHPTVPQLFRLTGAILPVLARYGVIDKGLLAPAPLTPTR